MSTRESPAGLGIFHDVQFTFRIGIVFYNGRVSCAGFGLAGGSPWPTVLWHAGAGALVAALLARWWSRVWLTSLSNALHDRRPSRASAPADTKPAMRL